MSLPTCLPVGMLCIVLVFEQFAEEFAHLLFGGEECLTSGRRNPVEPPVTFAVAPFCGYQETPLFQRVEQGIHRACTELVIVSRQLFHHPEPENLSLGGVMEDVKSYEARVQVLMSGGFVVHRPGYHIVPACWAHTTSLESRNLAGTQDCNHQSAEAKC